MAAPACPVCGSPVEFLTVTAENRFGDRRQATVAACTGCELIDEQSGQRSAQQLTKAAELAR